MTGAPAIVPNRKISGASAVLMTVNEDGSISWSDFEQHLERTVQAGLTPAVNMDTGFGPYLSAAERSQVLTLTKSFGVKFIGGVHLDDQPGDAFNPGALLAQSVAVAESGAVPILFPSHGMSGLSEPEVLGALFIELVEWPTPRNEAMPRRGGAIAERSTHVFPVERFSR